MKDPQEACNIEVWDLHKDFLEDKDYRAVDSVEERHILDRFVDIQVS